MKNKKYPNVISMEAIHIHPNIAISILQNFKYRLNNDCRLDAIRFYYQRFGVTAINEAVTTDAYDNSVVEQYKKWFGSSDICTVIMMLI